MREEELAKKLSAIVKKHSDWGEDFDRLTVVREGTWTELFWTDSGVGEDYILEAFRKEWPDRVIDMDIEGGCGSCGWGRGLSVTITGATPPWEIV